LKGFLEKIKKYVEISHVLPISRRYFIMNSFDGAMTTLGIVLGSYITGIISPSKIISIGLATAFAMVLSGFFGTYLTEEAEREAMLKEIEVAMLQKLRKTIVKRAHTFATLLVAIVDSLAPITSTLISLSPFFLSLYGILGIDYAVILSIFLTLVNLFYLGYFLGKISRKSLIKSGFKMLAAGIIATIVLLFIGKYG
jgi:predicted membrane protein (TIGR00267 family)